FGDDKLYFEPVADVAWSRTSLDTAGFKAQGAKFTFDDATFWQGSLGARFGGNVGQASPWLGAYWVDSSDGQSRVSRLTGAGCPSCVTLKDETRGAYGKADFGLTFKPAGDLEGFVKGEALFGGDVQGFAASLGARWRW